MAESGAVKLRIEKLVAGGDGLGFLDGKAVFAPFALPGETILARVAAQKKDYCRAEMLELLEPSPRRVEASCPLYGLCGGCNLQHLDYSGQLEAKSRIVEEAFARMAKLETGPVPIAPSTPFAYRNRMQLHFTKEGRLGLARRSSAELVELPGCPIACGPVDAWISSRAGTSLAREELGQRLNGADRFLVFGYRGEAWVEGLRDRVEVEVAGRIIRFRIQGFFQSNLSLLDAFAREATEGLSGERAADLYCGVGLFGSFLASSFGSVVCVEENAASLAMARENLPGGKGEFHAQSTEAWTLSASARAPFDLVLADPPRTGLAPVARKWLAEAKPGRIVYLSCDPATLARDAGELLRSGYELESIKAFDFYPQTGHVECHARFKLR
jgi:23S rRNA (uracil1939-C5)-methyltransferase